MRLYMAVTPDEYELPLCVGTSREVAEYAGITMDALYIAALNTKRGKLTGRNSGRKIIKVECDDE